MPEIRLIAPVMEMTPRWDSVHRTRERPECERRLHDDGAGGLPGSTGEAAGGRDSCIRLADAIGLRAARLHGNIMRAASVGPCRRAAAEFESRIVSRSIGWSRPPVFRSGVRIRGMG